ncbi:uncharacterized protein BDZ99DRAFT_499634 [Mytilinidion resinicola]|uniref:Uncharacterized protein n=1 Tax=Mytilinidion resinicola TaxID=574789 RepID=A0A6A6YJY3_9PEZI|nr:uncharacterized protein BDZ99DRAFT_499634 [Mytilinidion resinicola]KAF2808274.1 hypothetical protein BDZ99DRAFT_499634 [Mytilinidion resinicola]
MASTLLPSGGIALHGAPDSDISTKEARSHAVHVMQLEITQDIINELLESAHGGKPPQILFGRNPQLKYGDKSHVLQTTSENLRYELYHSAGPDSQDEYTFAGLINHSLAIQHAEQVTSGVDTALEQLKSSMAAIHNIKEANKTTVVKDADASSLLTPSHRRGLSKNFKPQQHLKPSSNLSSPLRSVPSSPALNGLQNLGKGPTSQPSSQTEKTRALRYVTVHYLALEPQPFEKYVNHIRARRDDCKEVLQKVGKNQDGKWHLTDRAFKDLDPYKFPYQTSEDREKAVKNAVKAFDRLRIAKDDKIWQMLLPKEERGKGMCLSRLNVTAPSQRPSTPMQSISKLTEKKAGAGTKGEEKKSEKEGKKVREVKEKKPAKEVKESTSDEPKMVNNKKTASQLQTGAAKTKVKKSAALSTAEDSSTSTSRQKTKATAKTTTKSTTKSTTKTTAKEDSSQEKMIRSGKPTISAATKPKNPSPLSASPPVNASDFDDAHPVHKALSAAPSPAKSSSGNSDHMLKRKANDLDSNIHNHNLSVKVRRVDRSTPIATPLSTSGKTSTPSSAQSLKRKAVDTDFSDISRTHTPMASGSKVRKVNSIDTAAASRYNAASPQSDTTTSPPLPLSYRQTIELSQKFERYYKKYEQLYFQLADDTKPPNEEQRDSLMKMHRKLEEMKREIKAGARHSQASKEHS